MPEKETPAPKESKDYTFQIILAIIGVISAALVAGIPAYLNYRDNLNKIEVPLRATQTAEVRATDFALTLTSRAEFPSPTPTLTDTPTPSPTPVERTSTATLVPDAGLRFCVNARADVSAVWVRSGPSKGFAPLGTLANGACIFFDASNEEETWLRIAPGQTDIEGLAGGWISKDLLGIFGPVDLPAVPNTPTPTEPPTPSETPEPGPSPTLPG